jgi:hypothetical protein
MRELAEGSYRALLVKKHTYKSMDLKNRYNRRRLQIHSGTLYVLSRPHLLSKTKSTLATASKTCTSKSCSCPCLKSLAHWRYIGLHYLWCNFTIAMDVMPLYIDAYGFILLRVGGSVLCFGWFGFLCQIEIGDFSLRYSGCFFGVAFNMLTFF